MELRQDFQELREDVRRLMQVLASPAVTGNGTGPEQRTVSPPAQRGIWTGESWLQTREAIQAALRDTNLFQVQGGGGGRTSY